MASPRLMATLDLQDHLSAKLDRAARSLDRFAQRMAKMSAVLSRSLSPDVDKPARRWEQFARRVGDGFATLMEGMRWAFVKASGSFVLLGSTAVTAGTRAVSKFLDVKSALVGIVHAALRANREIARLAAALGLLTPGSAGAREAGKAGLFGEILDGFDKMIGTKGTERYLKLIGFDPATMDKGEKSVYASLRRFVTGVDEELAALTAFMTFGELLVKKFETVKGVMTKAGELLGGKEALKAAGSSFTRQGAMGGVRTIRQFGKVGRAAPWIAVGASALELALAKPSERSKVAFDNLGGLAGGIAGAKMGAAMGAALGTAVPVIGNAVGAALGALIGGLVGMGAGEKFAKAFREKGLAAAIGEVVVWLGELSVMLIEYIGKALGWLADAVLQGLAWVAGVVVGAFENAWTGIKQWWEQPDKWTWLGQTILNAVLDGLAAIGNKLKEWGSNIWDWVTGAGKNMKKAYEAGNSLTNGTNGQSRSETITLPQHHRGGLVADEGLAVLKRKEMVLDPELSGFIRGSAARASGQGSGSGGPVTVQIGALANTVHVREEADLQKLARSLARELQQAMGNRGQFALAEVAM